MKESSVTNFGLLIAFLLPGFVALWGIGYISEPVRSWFGASPTEAPTIGGFMYVTLASIIAGLAVSTIRWIFIDTLHHRTGIARPDWNFSRLQDNVAAYDVIREMHYRYYQFYANMIVAIVFGDVMRHLTAPGAAWLDLTDAATVALSLLFFAGSRDTLNKYYRRGEQLLAKKRRRSDRPSN